MSAPVTQKKVRSAGEMSPGRLALRRFLSNKLALVGGITLIVIAILSLFAPFIAQHDPTSVDLSAIRQAPSVVHWLGTDDAGRDVFARFLYAGRVSLVVGLLAALLSVVIGSIVGAIAGLLGGWVDVALMRLADIFLSFPSLVVVMAVAGILGPSVTMLILAIGLFEWPAAARVVRGISLQTRELEYVQAARGAGARSTWLIVRHLLPASLIPIVVVATLGVASAILLEAALSFLGLGVQPPQSSWGNMLNAAQSLTVISTMPWLWLPPGLAVAVTVLAVNFVGDGLRDAVDPRRASRGRKRKSTKGFPS